MESTTVDKKIMLTGGSLTIAITKELRNLGLDKGDMVRVTLEKL